MRRTKLLIPDKVEESVTVTPLPSYEEQSSVSYVDFIEMKRFAEQVGLTPCLTPVAFRDTIVCFENSPQKRYKSETHYVPKVRPKKYADTLIIFPKRPQKSFVTLLDYHIDECRRWFKTTMEFKARTYTTQKIIPNKVDPDKETTENGVDDGFKVRVNDGPGASQIFLPRWNKDRVDMEEMKIGQHLMNGEVLVNGF